MEGEEYPEKPEKEEGIELASLAKVPYQILPGFFMQFPIREREVLLVKLLTSIKKSREHGKPHAVAHQEKTLKQILKSTYKEIKDLNSQLKQILNSEETIDFDLAMELIEAGADLNTQSDEGDTLLIFATDPENKEMAETLIKKGANVNLQNNAGLTALMYAATNGNEKIVEMLIKNGAGVNIKNIEGETALSLLQHNMKPPYLTHSLGITRYELEAYRSNPEEFPEIDSDFKRYKNIINMLKEKSAQPK